MRKPRHVRPMPTDSKARIASCAAGMPVRCGETDYGWMTGFVVSLHNVRYAVRFRGHPSYAECAHAGKVLRKRVIKKVNHRGPGWIEQKRRDNAWVASRALWGNEERLW